MKKYYGIWKKCVWTDLFKVLFRSKYQIAKKKITFAITRTVIG